MVAVIPASALPFKIVPTEGIDPALYGAHLSATNSEAPAPQAAPDALDALKKVMSWIDNWSPEFTNDPEWPADRDAARAAIAQRGAA
jgi:hypothetical protein